MMTLPVSLQTLPFLLSSQATLNSISWASGMLRDQLTVSVWRRMLAFQASEPASRQPVQGVAVSPCLRARTRTAHLALPGDPLDETSFRWLRWLALLAILDSAAYQSLPLI